MVAEALVRSPEAGQTAREPALASVGGTKVVWLEGQIPEARLPVGREHALMGGFDSPTIIVPARSGRSNPTLTATLGRGASRECFLAWEGGSEGVYGVHIWGQFLSADLRPIGELIQVSPPAHGAAYGGSFPYQKHYAVAFEPRTQTLLVTWIGNRDHVRTLGWRTINAVTHAPEAGWHRVTYPGADADSDPIMGLEPLWVDVAAADGPEYLLRCRVGPPRAEAFFLAYVGEQPGPGEHQVRAIALDAAGLPLWESYSVGVDSDGNDTYDYEICVAGQPSPREVAADRETGTCDYFKVATAYDPRWNRILVVYWRPAGEEGLGPRYGLYGRFVPGAGLLVRDRELPGYLGESRGVCELPGNEMRFGVTLSESQRVEDGRLLLVYSKRQRRYTVAYTAKGAAGDVGLYALELSENAVPVGGTMAADGRVSPMRLASNVSSFDLKVHAGAQRPWDIGGRIYHLSGGKGEKSPLDNFHLVAEEHSTVDPSAGGIINEYLWTELA